jgi:hypothetical protein
MSSGSSRSEIVLAKDGRDARDRLKGAKPGGRRCSGSTADLRVLERAVSVVAPLDGVEGGVT